jgi:hypothetical protein
MKQDDDPNYMFYNGQDKLTIPKLVNEQKIPVHTLLDNHTTHFTFEIPTILEYDSTI